MNVRESGNIQLFESMQRRKVMPSLITGGAGFIGSHLCEALLARGGQVIILDDLSTGSMENIRHLQKNPQLHCVFDSMMNPRALADLVHRADTIYHLAAAVGVRRIIDTPVRTIETNVRGTELVLECAARKGRTVFVASTSEVYGKNASMPFREDDDVVLGPSTKSRWSYAASKHLDEFLALAYWKEKNLPVVIGRLFNTVGPRQTGRYGMVLPTFVCQALENAPITVYGTGQQKRCFGSVTDVVEAIIRLVSCRRALGEVVNIGNDEEISIEQLAFLVRERTQSASPIHLIPYDQAYAPGFEDMQRRVPCVEKLVSLTGFRPTTPLRVVIDQVAAYWRAERSRLPTSLNISTAPKSQRDTT